MPASDKHVLDYTGLQYFKGKIYSDLKTINGAAITGGGNLSLVVANAAITGATKCKITYDSKGLVTGGADLAASDIPSLAASKIASGTFDTARIPSLAISKITDLQATLDAKLAAKPDGTNNLIDNNKISIKYLPDVVLGQLIFGGTVTGAGVATLSTNAKTKLGTTSSSITLTNNTTAITGYVANEGIFYVVTSDGSFASLGLKTGDWLISTGDAWRKVDNTDEVTSVQIQGTANVLSSSVSTAQTGAVSTVLNLVAGHGDTVNPYGNKTKNYVLAAPSTANGTPSFRALVADDIPDLSDVYASINDVIVSNTYFTSTWVAKTWSGFTEFTGENIWTDGENIYYSFYDMQYILNKTTSTWVAKTWSGLTEFEGRDIWTDGENTYCSMYTTQYEHYILNKTTSTWVSKTWSGFTEFDGREIWTDGENIYYSDGSYQYVLNKTTSTWVAKTWSGFTEFTGENIWTDGENIYYSFYDMQYILNKTTSTWVAKTWSGLTSFDGKDIWTDGENIYYSRNSTQYVLDKTTSTWVAKTWSGLTSFISGYIWTDGENIYYSYYDVQYILNKVNTSEPVTEYVKTLTKQSDFTVDGTTLTLEWL